MKQAFATLLIFTTSLTQGAEATFENSLISGNAALKSNSVEKIARKLIANQLIKNSLTSSQTSANDINFEVDSVNQTIKIPENPFLKDILSTLGIADHVQVSIDPIHTEINFDKNALKMKIEKLEENLFKIHAQWAINTLNAQSSALKIHVPRGLFDQDFTISAKPVQISLNQATGPITADLVLLMSLSIDGAKIQLQSFKTNLQSKKQKLKLKLGTLYVNNRPLELEVISNGKRLYTKEPALRAELQAFGPGIIDNIQKKLALEIQTKFQKISSYLASQPPFNLTLDSNQLIQKLNMSDTAVINLFKNISANFIFSYVQELTQQKLFSTQISSHSCIDNLCLLNNYETTQITTEDIKPFMHDDAGVIIYESWVQNLVNSPQFQNRIHEYFQQSMNTPGVALGKSGVKIHFNHEKNAIIAVVNLEIDIKKTSKKEDGWRSSFLNNAADYWEQIVGSGELVILPVEVTLLLGEIKENNKKQSKLEIKTEIPFNDNGTVSNIYGYPSNLEKMNKNIRKKVLDQVKARFTKLIPSADTINLSEILSSIEGIQFEYSKIAITKNKGLLVSGRIQ